VKATVYGVDGNSDTYITNKIAVQTVPVFESYASKFIPLNDLETTSIADDASTETTLYSGGNNGNTLYRSRSYLKVGGNSVEKYRTVLLLNPRNYFASAVGTLSGYTTGSPYTIANATLTLKQSSGATGQHLEAVLLPLDMTIDSSVSWYKPSEASSVGWTAEGGDADSRMNGIVPVGIWNGSTVSFDLTPFANIWDTSGYSLFAIMIKGTEADSAVTQFYSWESENTPVGGSSLANCKFLGSGDISQTQTEGIRVLVSVGSTTTVSLADERTTAIQQWSSFGAATSTGTTFTFFSPDTEQGVVIGSITCTLNDRVSNSVGSPLVVSGISLPAGITQYYTTAEFSGTSPIPLGTNILEITAPSTQTITDVSKLISGETLLVNYTAGSANSNSHSFTVKFTSDETLKQSRVRIYLNETTISENRIGLNTNLFTVMNRPNLTADLLLI
jgi:hypothetical protein